MFSSLIENLPIILLGLPAVLLALSFHEMCHAFAANKLGDPTARSLGRMTLNPFKHIDPIGFICMLLFHFGWANPVPINTRYFKKPRRDMALSSAAGPLSNLLLGIISALVLRLALFCLWMRRHRHPGNPAGPFRQRRHSGYGADGCLD